MLVGVVSVSLVNGLTIVATVIIMFKIDWQLTLLAFTVLPFLFFINRFFTKRIRANARLRRKKEGEIASLVQEDLSQIRTIQAFSREDHEDARFNVPALQAFAAGLRSTRLQAQFSPLSTFITGLGTTLVVFLGARSVLQDRITLGTLLVLMTYLRSLYSPVKQLSKLVNVVSRATVSAERVAEILDATPEICDTPDAIEAPRLRGEVHFENVSFAYRLRDSATCGPSVLRDLNLDVPAGTTVALVGHTGAGKTTLVGLLPRFFDPLSGRVLIDGHDLRSLKLATLRNQISIVPQEAILFRASIWENIAYGSELFPPGFGKSGSSQPLTPSSALMAEIRAAADAANAHEFICQLSEGYNTIVGERGNTLSGGQRQRIAIARAMIRKAPILILDEPTTGLDSESEDLVLEAINRLKAGRTTFIIAHRLTTIRSADQIIVLEAGQIAQFGTHQDLYCSPGRYRDYYDRQFQWETAKS
jgi:ABC-type multidrug transport system fused ATPase/permease subunit